MLFTLLIIWCLSPLVLIPAIICLGVRKSKLERFISRLIQCGRVSNYEYGRLDIENPSEAVSVKNSRRNNDEETLSSDELSAETADVSHRAFYEYIPESPVASEKAIGSDKAEKHAPVHKEEKHANTGTVLFSIGTAFVILAGIIFSTAIWVYLSDFARSAIIAFAGLFFFGLSAVTEKKFRLENTSSVFYLIGTFFTSISFITAGFFNLFGQWFSVSGDGNCLFFAFSAFIVSLLAFIRLRKNSGALYEYTTLYTALAGVTLVIGQLASGYESFSMMITLLGVALTAGYTYFSKKTVVRASLLYALISARIIYSLISLYHLADGIFNFGTSGFILCGIFLAELTAYGLIRNSRLLLCFQSILALGFSFSFCGILNDNDVNEYLCIFIFGIICASLCAVYRFYSRLYTRFADVLFGVIAFICGFVLLQDQRLVYGIILAVCSQTLIMWSALSFRSFFSFIARIITPLPLITVAYGISDYLFFEHKFYDTEIVWLICGIILAGFAFACYYFAKGDNRFTAIKYSLEITASAIMWIISASCDDARINASIIVVCAVLYAVMHTSASNLHSVIPVASFFTAVKNVTEQLSGDNSGDTLVIFSIVLCAVFTVASRVFYSKKLIYHENGRARRDTLMTGIPMSLLLLDGNCDIFSYDALVFIAFLEIAVFFANLSRSDNSKRFNAFAYTLSFASVALALINRPFMLISDDVISSKITLTIVVLYGFAVKKIWRRNPEFADKFSSNVYMLAYILLLFDALANQTLLNTLAVLITSLVILLISFAIKKKRWFTASATGLTGLTLYITKDFISEINWWVYLLLAGILLISIASANEYFKNKADSFKSKAGEFFSGWSW
ncbi:MAG: DUF2157 domain-containing protein [Ruminococcus sp.]|nr:DUF2157 domain-containing protein [Ruminococcus sp.]